ARAGAVPDEDPESAGQGGRIARDVHDAPGRAARQDTRRRPRQTGARRVEEDRVETRPFEELRQSLARVATQPADIAEPRARRIVARRGDRLARRVERHDLAAAAGHREGEEPHTAVELEERLVRARCELPQDGAPQDAPGRRVRLEKRRPWNLHAVTVHLLEQMIPSVQDRRTDSPIVTVVFPAHDADDPWKGARRFARQIEERGWVAPLRLQRDQDL